MTRKRRGFALIELVLALTALAIMFAVAVSLIHALLRLDRIGRDHLAESASRERLARQLRSDVRAAASAEPEARRNDPSPRLRLALPGGRTVEYTTKENRVERVERDRGGSVRTESFRFPGRTSPRFAVDAAEGARFVTIVFRRPRGSRGDGGLRDLEASAMLARDKRLAEPEGGAR
jgi:prepilin-type N-terminal cleavage/methylation domain-containing protein